MLCVCVCCIIVPFCPSFENYHTMWPKAGPHAHLSVSDRLKRGTWHVSRKFGDIIFART